MHWRNFKENTEKVWKHAKPLQYIWGYQVRPGSTWNKGLNQEEIKSLEVKFGFKFPNDYVSMLGKLNGIDKEFINFHGGEEKETYSRQCYKYPDDFEKVQWLVAEIAEFRKYVDEIIEECGLYPNDIVGFIPLYSHRALVVFNDKSLSPVISIVGDDVILYGNSLKEYWQNEFLKKTANKAI